MAMITHAASDNEQIVSLSVDIGLTQHGQIGMMQAWLRGWGLGSSGTQPQMAWMADTAGSVRTGLMPGMATAEQMSRLRTLTGRELDIQFLTLMRQHHLGGVHMAQGVLNVSDDDDVTWLAQGMVTAQQGEIELIQRLLNELQAKS